MSCWLARFSDKPCDGPTDKAHMIPKQLLKRELGDLAEMIWHPSVWVHACRRHHGDFDNRVIHIAREDVPVQTERFADVFGLTWWLERTYGPHPEIGQTTEGSTW